MEKIKNDLIIVPFHDYKKWLNEGFRTRDAHLYQQAIKSGDFNKIIIVNRPLSLIEMLLKKTSWKTFPYKQNLLPKKHVCLQQVDSRTYCLDFFSKDIFKVIKTRKKWWYYIFNKRYILNGIKLSIKTLHLNNPIIILQNPMAIGIPKNIEHSKLVFDCIDNWLEHPQMKKNYALIKRNYNYLDKNSDCITIVSKNLKSLFPTNNSVSNISNGVDLDYFKNCIKLPVNKIKIGYVGKIQQRVDFNLVEECLIKYPKYQFIFAGPIYAQKLKLKQLSKKYSNIRFIGDVHYNDLPNFLKSIDIAIIPHTVDEFTSSMNPLKTYEYIAAGKPVVTTAVSGVSDVSKFILVSKDNTEFVNSIDKCVNMIRMGNYNPKNVQNSISTTFSWKSKYLQIHNYIHRS